MKQLVHIRATPNYWPFGDVYYTIQSPIDVQSSDIIYLDLPPLVFHLYPDINQHTLVIENNGYTVEVHLLENDFQIPYLTGGPLGDIFLFENMHLHWGQQDNDGSENRVDGQSFSCEVHMVYYNKMYGSFEEAKDKKKGLTVLAFFGIAGDEDNVTMEGFINDLQNIQQPGDKIYRNFGRVFSWIERIISNEDWISYPGSLTTPPYYETVTWIVMTTPFALSHRQLNQFRTLYTKDHHRIIGNHRSLQHPNRRPVIQMKPSYWPLFKKEAVIVEPHIAIQDV